MEYAYEGDQLSGEGQPSFFTEAVVEGLRSGKADRDQDRWISVDDLYGYVHESVRAKTPSQTPNMKSELEGPLYIARSVYEPPVEPKQLDPRTPGTNRKSGRGGEVGRSRGADKAIARY